MQLNGLKRVLGNLDLWKKNDELVRLFTALETLGVKEYVKFDPSIMRGLLYYTGTVFEAFESSGSVKRAILGGGRYDNLLADVGGQALPGIGFAMGDVVIGIILKEQSLLPEFIPSPAPILVTIFDEKFVKASYSLAAELRKFGFNILCYPEPVKLQKQFKFADKMKVRIVLTLGPDELAENLVSIKDLLTGDQIKVKRIEIVGSIKRLLEIS
jgi:histidyl-tRNA synthetase